MRALLPLFLFSMPALAQDDCPRLDSVGVVIVDSATGPELYARAKRWFAIAFKDNREVVRMDDEANNTLIGKGTYEYSGGGWLHFTVEIGCKDGRYRFNIHDIYHEDTRTRTTYYGGVSSTIEYPDYGYFYDCDVCCTLYKNHKAEHPKQTAALAKNVKKCKTAVLPSVRPLLRKAVADIRKEMEAKTSTAGDW